MEDTQRIVKCGNLSLHTPGGFFKKRWHPKYLVLYDGSKSGVKRLELFDSEIKFKKQSPARIIPLVDCVRVVTCQRQKTTYTFEVRTSDQFYLLASQSFQDMTDWVNCLRLVAFGQSQQQQPTGGGSTTTTTSTTPAGNGNINSSQLVAAAASAALAKRQLTATSAGQQNRSFDVLLETRRAQQQQQHHQLQQVSATSRGADNVTPAEQVAGNGHKSQQTIMTASQAAAAAASALAKTRQRQPSLLGSCKPQPPTDSPFIHQQQQLNPTSASAISDGLGAGSALGAVLNSIGSMDTLTPTVRGQLISAPAPPTSTATATTLGRAATSSITQTPAVANQFDSTSSSSSTAGQTNVRHSKQLKIQATLDEEEENMLYCSIEDNPSEHNYRVKVIETELSLRCQLKCYQLTAPTLISEQYEELNLFRHSNNKQPQIVTFYQLIIGPQELTLLNDYATASAAAAVNYSPNKQQGLWSWPYQCIRRYGFDKDNCFMFEAGRKCTSGPGQFIVQTPKAYMIYQDVVKFVNELRTVSTTTATNSNSTNQEATNENNNNNSSNQAKQLVVTQIPVSWAPNEQANQQQADMKLNNLEINQLPDSLESRKHFFNALRQLDPSATIDDQDQEQRGLAKQQTPGSTNPASNLHLTRDSPSSPSASSSTSCDSGKRLDSPTMRAKDDKSKGVDSKSETDESGYDQGDDSVDSGSRSFKQQSPSASLLVASRKRQANDSMSSSSSTTSGGSPGHSISRNGRANVKLPSTTTTTNHGQGPAKRPPINGMAGMKAEATKSQPPTENPQQQLGLHHLIADEVLGGAGQATIGGPFNTNPRDFEANLIRDVYSEITKLHAKFAVTSSGSADDSMSSHSSQVESGTSDHLNKSGEEDEGGRDEFDDDFDHLDEIGEPTYSNVRLMPPNRRATEARRMRKRGGDFEESPNYDQENKQFHAAPRHEPQSHHQQLTATNSYSNNNGLDYLSSRQLYPTILNPIPECGELAHPQSNPQPPPPVAPKPQRFLSNNNNPHHRQQQPEMNQHKFNRPQHLSEIPTLIEKGLPRARLATRAMDKPTPHNENQPRGVGKQDHKANNNNVRQSPQTKTTNKMNNNSKLRPTNHYVINDVQYAKISRNLHPNFESCL